jgi:hypothetical protein
MRSDLPTPDLLAQAPELAVLEVLGHAGDTAYRALIAAHPELESPDFLLEQGSVTPALCLASTVLSSISLLHRAIDDYGVHVERLTQCRPPCGDADHDMPF